MKSVNQTTGKGILDVNWETGEAIITEITKDDEIPYNFFEILEKYNKKNISFRFAEEQPIEPLGED